MGSVGRAFPTVFPGLAGIRTGRAATESTGVLTSAQAHQKGRLRRTGR